MRNRFLLLKILKALEENIERPDASRIKPIEKALLFCASGSICSANYRVRLPGDTKIRR